MKNIKYILMTLLVSMVALTGCGKKNSLSPKETFEKTAANMKTVEQIAEKRGKKASDIL